MLLGRRKRVQLIRKEKEKKGRDAAGQREEGHGWPEGREMIRRRRDAAGQREEDTAS